MNFFFRLILACTRSWVLLIFSFLLCCFSADDYQIVIILMTDGGSDSAGTLRTIRQAWEGEGWDVPVFGILFGDGDAEQVEEIAQLTRGRVFDGSRDLVSALRGARGYN